MKKRIAAIVCSMVVMLAGCGANTIEVTIPLGEVGTVNSDELRKSQDGIKSLSQNGDTVTVNVAKDGTYYFYVIDDSGEEVEVVMTVEKGEVSVKTEYGMDVPYTSKQ